MRFEAVVSLLGACSVQGTVHGAIHVWYDGWYALCSAVKGPELLDPLNITALLVLAMLHHLQG